MGYSYQTQRSFVFTEDGQIMFLKIRDTIKEMLEISGAFRLGNIISTPPGDAWNALACVDRLVEIGEIREIHQPDAFAQHRVFVRANGQ